jgi:acetyl-CoA carboxylase biotin carboxyl carrier protein
MEGVSAVDLSRVEQLIELMRQSGVSQLSLELPDFKISITRGAEGTQVTTGAEAEKPPATYENQAAPPVVETASRALPVVSPVVGVFHNGGMLEPRDVVREGERVREGQLIAAIEAMKVPNELRAPVSGVVTRLLVADGAAVEYGQTLLLIEPEEGGEESDEETMVGLA